MSEKTRKAGAPERGPSKMGRPRKERPAGVMDQFTPRSPLTEQLGALLRSARERKSITLKQMSRRLDCSINALRMYEAGGSVMRADMLLQAATALDIDPADLLAIDPSLLTAEAA